MLATNKHQSRRVEHRVSSHNYFADDILPIYEGTKSGIEIGYVEEFVVRTYRIIGRTSGGSVLRSEIVTLSAVRKLEYLWRVLGRKAAKPPRLYFLLAMAGAMRCRIMHRMRVLPN
jgi:hypothetical protein